MGGIQLIELSMNGAYESGFMPSRRIGYTRVIILVIMNLMGPVNEFLDSEFWCWHSPTTYTKHIINASDYAKITGDDHR